MPLYRYKAVNKAGDIVEYRAESINQYELIKKLKMNELLPIQVTQINNSVVNKKQKRQKKNIEYNDRVLKSLRNEEIRKSLVSKPSLITKAKRALNKNAKVTKRDIAIFTENFYKLSYYCINK